ncbi:hypothetical protein MY04_1645 [Flammeovirga sp. MY04]|uniref:hypothetical protein n=1 Tax=Flammeovirga sp. MY04 TaxID=1191459 RepID=UPI0008062154|nr:hypothetical protein [Flammeovirga sp. MY04]ANQ49019.1 hypothetical protein MY04_1645 [Flammeovirga sp. MY04]
MQITTWNRLDDAWKEIILFSIKVQEENIESEKVHQFIKEENDLSKVYQSLFDETLEVVKWPDFTFFNRLIPLDRIYASYQKIDSLDPLMFFPLVKEVYADHTDVADLDSLMLCSALETLIIDDSYVDDLQPIMNHSIKTLSIKNLVVEQSQIDTVLLRQPNCTINQ